jgi:hypothetical protein
VRVLLDDCVNVGVRTAFLGLDVQTVTEIGWRSSKDGPLLSFVQTSFDVFVTIDRKLEYQQNLRMLNLGVIIVHVRNNELESYRPLFNALFETARTIKAGQVIHLRR